jgi:DNA topoisomerase-1
MDVVVVESPAKAKTIGKYLGPGYKVLASFGHVRDLPAKDGSVRPERDFAMDWEVDAQSQKRLNEIAKAVKDARHLYLATDPDREGEAISWHVLEVLDQKRALKGVNVKRVAFNAITKRAVQEAIAHPREIDGPLVDAYLARRALDYLVGFTLSPVLWRKLPGSRSAGRVQSVALRLICEREAEIEVFRAREYWTVDTLFRTPRGQMLKARLTHLNGSKLDKFDLDSEDKAKAAREQIEHRAFTVTAIDRRQVRRNPPPPFITSSLQMEASRKLGLGAGLTMRLAQRLYEGIDMDGETVGLITYMRTDGVDIEPEALAETRKLIESRHGGAYLPEKPRFYTSKVKNAQEAHEAIRPTDLFRTPESLERYLDRDQLRLYELIWKRTVACQMESAVLDQVTVDIGSGDRNVILRATGSVVKFDGFLTLYEEGRDDQDSEDGASLLPDVREAEPMERREVLPEQHFTEPPPRYSEASLVKRLEELGIGRPSTYASIIEVLQARKYVQLDRKRFVPEDRGRIVTAFLASYFPRYVEYDFTANLEEQLDDISGGRVDWKAVLRDFWKAFSAAVDGTKELRVKDVLDQLDQDLGPHFFPDAADGKDPRVCPGCSEGRLSLKLGRFGAFIGCSRYPDCRYTRRLGVVGAEGADTSGVDSGPVLLGNDPEAGLPVSLRKGPYGTYVQLGEANGDEKPKRSSLPKGLAPADVDLAKALALLNLPREIGAHPDTGEPITAGIGRFGPYVRHGPAYKTIPGDEDVLTIGMNRAVALLAEAKGAGRRQPVKPLRVLGTHPADGQPVEVYEGRYGPYVKHGRTNATLPREVEPGTVTLEQALPLIEAKGGKSATAKPRGKAAAAKGARSRKANGAAADGRPAAETAAAKHAAKRPARKAKGKKPAAKGAAKATTSGPPAVSRRKVAAPGDEE